MIPGGAVSPSPPSAVRQEQRGERLRQQPALAASPGPAAEARGPATESGGAAWGLGTRPGERFVY